jgi:hypothetical protein
MLSWLIGALTVRNFAFWPSNKPRQASRFETKRWVSEIRPTWPYRRSGSAMKRVASSDYSLSAAVSMRISVSCVEARANAR